MTQDEIRKMADREQKVSDIKEGSFLRKIAEEMVKEYGFYTYNVNGEKVYVS